MFPVGQTFTNSNFRDPNRGFRIWGRGEIVSVPGQVDKYWPNKDDLVFDPLNGFEIVVEVDPTTGMSDLIPWYPPTEPTGDANDMLVAVGPGYPSESFRMFLDTSTTPFTLTPDDRLHAYSSLADYYLVFLGSDISDATGKVISAYYDGSLTYLGPEVPFESVPVEGPVQTVIKAHLPAFTSERLADNELVTIVHYNAQSGPTSKAQLLIMNSAAIRRSDTSKKYVKSIKIDSPYINSAEPRVIEFPLNVTVESLPMTLVVTYRDGKTNRMNMDNTVAFLHGLNNYIATEVGQEFALEAAYQLAEDEIAYGLTPTANRRIVESYIARTGPVDGAYECRLFVYPVWVSDLIGYRLEFWLYNMDRSTFYNVTSKMVLGQTSRPFDPVSYGTLQTLTYSVNLNAVDGRFLPFQFVSKFQIALLQPGSNRTANWEVFSRPDQASAYGRDLKGDMEYLNANLWNLRLANGAQTKEDWLRKMYYGAEPLVNPELEVTAPIPTHFRVVLLHNTYEFSVNQWNEVLKVNEAVADGELVYLQWIQRTALNDLQLAMTAVPSLQRV
jgi:hypothetical protein